MLKLVARNAAGVQRFWRDTARRPGVAFPLGQTLGQTASFRQTAPETWCQSRICGRAGTAYLQPTTVGELK